MGFPNPYATWEGRKDRSPGELAQKWAAMVRMGLMWYADVDLTERETEALAVLIAKFLTETKKKSGVDLTDIK